MNSMQILCFFAAARSLNFTQSAAELFISQPAFSHNISSLEKEWEIELFSRNKKRKDTYLTPAGLAMYEGMKNLSEQYEKILQNARSIHEGKAGSLRIGFFASDRIDERTLTLFDRFQEKCPTVELSLMKGSSSELLKWLYNDTIDMAFSLKIDIKDKEWLISKELFKLETVLLLSIKHPLAKKENLSLFDFRNDIFIGVSPKESPAVNALLTMECEKAGFKPKVVEAPDISSQILYLEAGKGVAICNLNNIAAYNSRIKVKRLRDLFPIELVIAWNSANKNPCIELFNSAYEPIE